MIERPWGAISLVVSSVNTLDECRAGERPCFARGGSIAALGFRANGGAGFEASGALGNGGGSLALAPGQFQDISFRLTYEWKGLPKFLWTPGDAGL